jgi:hypothetical protein
MRDGDRWALFGEKAEDTYEAVLAFRDRELPPYLDEVWAAR